ncbi:tetratricopeptide repeat-containing sensor histidine kinase [Cellulophaga fucicola]|uniref:Uncharacterized protein n=1 Tax=Cellulophaga fucicola TaxID=76595 RepID=A0A1K1Q6I6_9FLAO|nr:tetratricopeptide repeat-containing sensor histidine kinase [Cellulophaga fucicola]SFW55333.1 hypothetical protein SAMN05660313_02379 [Cellulophaga fucicola]
MGKFFVFIVVLLFFSCTSKQNATTPSTASKLDSVSFYLNKAANSKLKPIKKIEIVNKAYNLVKFTNDELYNTVLTQKTHTHLLLQQYDSLLFYSKLFINHSKYTKNKTNLGYIHYLKAYYFYTIANNIDSAFVNYNLSKNQYKAVNDSSWIAKNLISISNIQKNKSDFFGSKETITEALQYLIPDKDSITVAHAYNSLATNHRKLLNFNDAELYYKKAINLTTNPNSALTYKNNLAASYISAKKYTKAITLLTEVYENDLTQNDKKQAARVLDNLAYAKWLNGSTHNIEADLLNALLQRTKHKDLKGKIASYTHLGEFYLAENPKKASSYLDSVITLSKVVKNPKAEKDALSFLIKVHPKNINYRDRYLFIQDSLYKNDLKVKTQFAKYKYDDALKEESILRLEKEKAQKELELTQQRAQKQGYSIGVMVLLLGLGFLFYFYTQRSKRLKQQNKLDKLQATLETEAQLSRKLHDDFGAKINHAMVLVQSNTDTSKILDSLEDLYKQSRDFSREINDVDTSENYKDHLYGMLQQNKPQSTKLIITGGKDIDWSAVNNINKTVLYKVLRELIINTKKHSKATAIKINFNQTAKILEVICSDNGIGAEKNALNTKNGLLNTEKRIKAINGTIIFETDKHKGFKTLIKIPN